METHTLIYMNLEQVMQAFINEVADTYRNYLKADGKKASGALISSITPQKISINGGTYTASISLVDYWKWVENGRRPGKFPPVKAIVEWIREKPILPREVNGLKPTTDQLAFLIGRKIATEGIKPGNQLHNAVDKVYDKYIGQIYEAIDKDIDNYLTIVNRTLTKY